MRTLGMFSAVLALAIASGCDDSTLPTAPVDHSGHAAATITVEPATASLALGESLQFTATPECEHGVALDLPVTWSASDAELVSLEPDGTVIARDPGDVTLTASVDGVTGAADLELTGAFIGPDGGVAMSGDRNVVLQIPPDALITVTEVIIRPAADDMLPPDAGYVPGTAYSCEPDGLQFREQARVQIHFDPAQVPAGYDPQHLRLRHRERLRAHWEETGQNQLMDGQNTVQGQIEHLSVYALVGVNTADVSSGEVGAIRITVWGERDLLVGETTSLTATVYDASNSPRSEWKADWTSEDPSVAEVFSDGTVVARSVGSTDIVASYGGANQSVTITVGGPPDDGHDEGYGNNLSWPVIFADGIGITGLLVTDDPGVRPTAAEGIVVDALPFFYSGNVADYQGYYTQQSANTWQAEWLDASASGTQSASVYWGDNLTHQTWSAESVIRIEHVLSAASGATLTGYNMTYLYGTGPDEMQGTDGTTGSFVPTMYSVVPRLTIEKLDAEGGNPVYTAFDGAVYEHIGVDGPGGYGAEVNVAGKVIYGYNLMMKRINMPAGVPKDGWWRITFSLDQSASVGGVSVSRNLSLDDLGNTAAGEELVYTPQLHPSGTRTWMDIFVTESPGGGGPGGGGGGSGGGGSGGGGGPP